MITCEGSPIHRPTTPSLTHSECNFVQSTEGSKFSSAALDKYVYKPRTDDEYFEALARGGQKSEVRVDVVNLATHHRPTMRQTITNISQLQLHHQRYSHRPPRPPPPQTGPPPLQTTRARHKKFDETNKMSAARWAQIKGAIMSAAAERHTRSNDGKIDAMSILMG